MRLASQYAAIFEDIKKFGIMEPNMETTMMGFTGTIGGIKGLYWDNGK